ncbi:MAG TPA: hypothetical protein VLA92_00690 [Candidatus Saccharimonadales bacterium]|nr:hypothetical protein [Candidatus Saccharimonadales bacterium]
MFGHDNQSQHQDAAVTTDDQNLGAAATGDTGEYMDTPDTPTAPTAPAADLPDVIDPTVAAVPAVAPTVAAPAVAAPTVAAVAPAVSADTDQLLDLKQQALQQLTPLVDHLEQNPEEKFRTTMMMIQAADNATLIKAAYDAALQIPDEKVRAQALLDIVNEINYFTHNNDNTPAAA